MANPRRAPRVPVLRPPAPGSGGTTPAAAVMRGGEGGRLAPAAGSLSCPRGGGSCQARACPGGSLGSSSALPTRPRSSSGGSEARGTEGINLKVYTLRVVYIKPDLFRASSSDMLAAALRACLSAGLLGRSLPLIAMSLSLLGTAGGRGSEITLSAVTGARRERRVPSDGRACDAPLDTAGGGATPRAPELWRTGYGGVTRQSH